MIVNVIDRRCDPLIRARGNVIRVPVGKLVKNLVQNGDAFVIIIIAFVIPILMKLLKKPNIKNAVKSRL